MSINYVLGSFLFLGVISISIGDEIPNCCPHNSHLDPFIRLCTGGEPPVLDCGGHTKFLFHPAEDGSFHIENGSLHIGATRVKPGEFCLVNLTASTHGPPANGSTEVAALACHVQDIPHHVYIRQILLSLCYFVSLLSLVLVLVAHISLSVLRDLHGKCHMATVTGLLLGLSSLLIVKTLTDDISEVMCQVLAFSVYFWFLTAFFWLNVTAFNVWRGVLLFHVRFDETRLFFAYCLYAWGVPLALLAFTAAMHLLPEGYAVLRPHFGLNTCWFHDSTTQWSYFYGPVAILLFLNCVLFVWTTYSLWTDYTTKSLPMKQRLQKRCLLSIKMFIIMGVGWIFELISSLDDDDSFLWFIMDAFNILQGLIIFMVLIIFRRRFWRAIHTNRPCGLDAPQWALKRFLAEQENSGRNMEELKYLQSTETV